MDHKQDYSGRSFYDQELVSLFISDADGKSASLSACRRDEERLKLPPIISNRASKVPIVVKDDSFSKGPRASLAGYRPRSRSLSHWPMSKGGNTSLSDGPALSKSSIKRTDSLHPGISSKTSKSIADFKTLGSSRRAFADGYVGHAQSLVWKPGVVISPPPCLILLLALFDFFFCCLSCCYFYGIPFHFLSYQFFHQ